MSGDIRQGGVESVAVGERFLQLLMILSCLRLQFRVLKSLSIDKLFKSIQNKQLSHVTITWLDYPIGLIDVAVEPDLLVDLTRRISW